MLMLQLGHSGCNGHRSGRVPLLAKTYPAICAKMGRGKIAGYAGACLQATPRADPTG